MDVETFEAIEEDRKNGKFMQDGSFFVDVCE